MKRSSTGECNGPFESPESGDSKYVIISPKIWLLLLQYLISLTVISSVRFPKESGAGKGKVCAFFALARIRPNPHLLACGRGCASKLVYHAARYATVPLRHCPGGLWILNAKISRQNRSWGAWRSVDLSGSQNCPGTRALELGSRRQASKPPDFRIFS